jgi:hypothetical protein
MITCWMSRPPDLIYRATSSKFSSAHYYWLYLYRRLDLSGNAALTCVPLTDKDINRLLVYKGPPSCEANSFILFFYLFDFLSNEASRLQRGEIIYFFPSIIWFLIWVFSSTKGRRARARHIYISDDDDVFICSCTNKIGAELQINLEAYRKYRMKKISNKK